jgi:hypothetical protein
MNQEKLRRQIKKLIEQQKVEESKSGIFDREKSMKIYKLQQLCEHEWVIDGVDLHCQILYLECIHCDDFNEVGLDEMDKYKEK